MRKDKKGGGGLDDIVHAIDTREHNMKVNVLGTVFTALSSLPRDLKRHLLLDGATTVFCDVSHAHHCFLPLLLSRRLAHPGANTDGIEAERERLIGFLSDGDYYYSKWRQNSNDPEERTEVKKLANVILNINNKQAPGIALYRRMAKEFPKLFRIIEDIKQNDHRNLSKQLQRFTSNAINGALKQLQSKNIPAIPDTDAILCRAKDKERVCEVIGEHLFRLSGGVRCKVGEIRFKPTEDASNLQRNLLNPSEDRASCLHRHSAEVGRCNAVNSELLPGRYTLPPSPDRADEDETQRIVGELRRMHREGILPNGEADRSFLATVIYLFDATYLSSDGNQT